LQVAEETVLGCIAIHVNCSLLLLMFCGPWSVCPSVNVLVTAVRTAKTAGPTKMPFGVWTRAFQFAIRIYSIRYANRFRSIRSVKKSAFRFTSCHAVFLGYLLYSLSQKNKLTSLFAAFNTLEHRPKTVTQCIL